jgi:hypothetical protein
MCDQIQDWWQSVGPEMQALVQDGGVVLGAFLGGLFIGGLVTRSLRARNFDAALRPPGIPRPSETDHGFTPTQIAGLLVRVTVWALAARWLAQEHGRADIAATVGLLVNRTWGLAALLVAALALGSLLARRLNDCLSVAPHEGLEARSPRSGFAAAASPTPPVARGVAASAYVLAVLLVLLTAADLFDWPLTRSSILALWQLTQQLLIAGAGLLIGYLGARWTRDLTASEAAGSPERRAGQYAALGIMASTTLLGVTVLISNTALLLGLAVLAGVGILLWVLRGYLPDVIAGLQLRQRGIREVFLKGERWQVQGIGLLTTQLSRSGEFQRMQNRLLLEPRPRPATSEAACVGAVGVGGRHGS